MGPDVAAPEPLVGSPYVDSVVLQNAMVTEDELPEGYSVIPDPVRDLGLDPAPDYESPDRSSTDPQQCADVLAPVSQQLAGASATADVRYSGPDFSSIDEDAASYADDGAARAFEAVQDAFQACSAFTGTDADGIGVDYSLEGRDEETIGDASTSVRLTTTSEGFTLVSEAVVAVVDRTVVQFVVTSQEGADPASLSALARSAAEKVRGASPGV